MKSNNNNYTNNQTQIFNLIGDANHKQFIKVQAAYGFAQRGGVKFPFSNDKHIKRLVSNVNLLSSQENKQLVFSEIVFSN